MKDIIKWGIIFAVIGASLLWSYVEFIMPPIPPRQPCRANILTIWGYRTLYNAQLNCYTPWFADAALSYQDDDAVNYTVHVLLQNYVTHIFIQKFSIDYESSHYQEKYDWDLVMFLEDNPEHFKNVYENGQPLEQCWEQRGCDGSIIYEVIY